MKKLVILSQVNIDYVLAIAKEISDPRSIKGNFSKALNKVIEEHKNKNDGR
jgi:hypothetical protein